MRVVLGSFRPRAESGSRSSPQAPALECYTSCKPHACRRREDEGERVGRGRKRTRERERRESERETECERGQERGAHAREGEMLACCRRSRNLLVRLIAGVGTVVHVLPRTVAISMQRHPTGEHATLGGAFGSSEVPHPPFQKLPFGSRERGTVKSCCIRGGVRARGARRCRRRWFLASSRCARSQPVVHVRCARWRCRRDSLRSNAAARHALLPVGKLQG